MGEQLAKKQAGDPVKHMAAAMYGKLSVCVMR